MQILRYEVHHIHTRANPWLLIDRMGGSKTAESYLTEELATEAKIRADSRYVRQLRMLIINCDTPILLKEHAKYFRDENGKAMNLYKLAWYLNRPHVSI